MFRRIETGTSAGSLTSRGSRRTLCHYSHLQVSSSVLGNEYTVKKLIEEIMTYIRLELRRKRPRPEITQQQVMLARPKLELRNFTQCMSFALSILVFHD